MKLQDSATMGHTVADHGSYDAELVGMPRDIGEKFAHRQSALAVMAKLPGRLEQAARVAFGKGERALEGERLAVVAREQRLGIERVEVGGSAVHEHEDDPLRSWR